MTRVLTALVLVPVALGAVVWAPSWLFALLLALLAVLGGREFFALAAAAGLQPYTGLGLAATAALVLCLALPHPAAALTAVLLAIVLAVLIAALGQPERMAGASGNAGSTLLGVFYPGMLLGVLGAIRELGFGRWWLVFLLLVVWLGDTAALYGGRAFGRHPMAPRVSPHKTWEGAAASLLAALSVGFALAAWLAEPRLVPLALALNLAAQAGDLAESLFKRGAGVKDSSQLLPGHGGVLDRVDALLLAAPVLWYYLAYLHR
ncbi:MAG TPA: phosphatidate cytidylyltransferase [Terriglobales bacterium]|nr:phosphatidate cytidylyltransferase [Terriglobales bacterium]